MQHPNTWYLPWGMPLQKMVAVPIHAAGHLHLQAPTVHMQPMLTGLPAPLTTLRTYVATQPTAIRQPQRKVRIFFISGLMNTIGIPFKRFGTDNIVLFFY